MLPVVSDCNGAVIQACTIVILKTISKTPMVLSRLTMFGLLQVGWKHKDAVAQLEEKRKERSAAFYQEKKQRIALRAKAAAQVAE